MSVTLNQIDRKKKQWNKNKFSQKLRKKESKKERKKEMRTETERKIDK